MMKRFLLFGIISLVLLMVLLSGCKNLAGEGYRMGCRSVPSSCVGNNLVVTKPDCTKQTVTCQFGCSGGICNPKPVNVSPVNQTPVNVSPVNQTPVNVSPVKRTTRPIIT